TAFIHASPFVVIVFRFHLATSSPSLAAKASELLAGARQSTDKFRVGRELQKEGARLSKYRAAIIGTGGISRAHAEALKASADRVEIVACVDIDRERAQKFAEQHGIPQSFTDAKEMLDRVKPDLVHICTPPSLHADLSILAVRSGAWVLCEKPLCGSLAELDAIQQAEEETGKYVSSVFQHRFGPGAAHLRQLIREQAMGRLLVGLCNTTWYRAAPYCAVPRRGKCAPIRGGPQMWLRLHQSCITIWF